MIERYDDAIVIEPQNGRWYFDRKNGYGISTAVQTNLRHKRRSDGWDLFFHVEGPDEGCAVVLGIYPSYRDKDDTVWARGLLGYAAFFFDGIRWQSLPSKKWIDIGPENRLTVLGEYAQPKLGIKIDELYLDLPGEIVLDFWADWLTPADTLAIHQELINKVKLKKLQRALELTKKLKGVLGIRSSTASEIQNILEDVMSNL